MSTGSECFRVICSYLHQRNKVTIPLPPNMRTKFSIEIFLTSVLLWDIPELKLNLKYYVRIPMNSKGKYN
jgi:hypothetical protein